MLGLLPCQKCESLCAVDADRCPNCGTKDIHGFPSKSKCFFYGVGCLIAGIVLSNESNNSLPLIFLMLGILGLIVGFFRSELLTLASKFIKD